LVSTAEDWGWNIAYPGNAKLLMGEVEEANQQIGVPGKKA
jgi:hypothetical protein